MALENDTRQSPEEALAEGSAQTDAILAELLGGGGAGGGEPEGGDAEPEPGGDEPEDDGTTEDAPEADAAPEGDSEPEEGDDPEPEPLDAADDAPAGSLAEVRAAAKRKDWKAFFEKLALKPEDIGLDTAGWTNWRKANDTERRKLREQEQEVTQKLTGWRDQLLSAQGQLEQRAKKLSEGEARIAKYVQAEEAFRKDGDPTHLVELVEAVAEVPFDEANRMILHKIRRTPGERALAKRLEEEARKREELEQRLAQQQQAPQASGQEQAERDHKLVDAHVDAGVRSGDLSADVKKVPHYRERIRRMVLESASKSPIGRPTVTIAQAAARVLKVERARISRHPLAPRGAAPAPAPARAGKRGGPPLRNQSRGEGAPSVGGEPASNDEIIAGIMKQRQQRVGA